MALCALDPSNLGANITLSNGDKTATKTASTWTSAVSEDSLASGKFYFEVEINSIAGNGCLVGIANENYDETSYPGADANSWAYHALGRKYHDGSWESFHLTYTANDIVGIAVDIDTGYVWFAKNNSFSGDPVNGTSPAFDDLTGNYIFAMLGLYASGGTTQQTIRILSADWDYSAPTGFSAILCDAQIDESFEISDAVDAWLDSGHISESFTISDDMDAQSTLGDTDESFEISDEIDAGAEYGVVVSENFEISDEFISSAAYPRETSENFEISDVIDALNWSRWLLLNQDRAITRYYFTLTGVADGTTDIEIPISSFQARKRSGTSTYLSVVIPNYVDYAGPVAARSNGQMVLEMAYLLDGVEDIRQEICRVDLENISEYQGANRRSIGLTGHLTVSYVSKQVTLENANYQSTVNGRRLFRFGTIDPFVNPGDTCNVGSDSFTVDFITFIVSAIAKTMEVHE